MKRYFPQGVMSGMDQMIKPLDEGVLTAIEQSWVDSIRDSIIIASKEKNPKDRKFNTGFATFTINVEDNASSANIKVDINEEVKDSLNTNSKYNYFPSHELAVLLTEKLMEQHQIEADIPLANGIVNSMVECIITYARDHRKDGGRCSIPIDSLGEFNFKYNDDTVEVEFSAGEAEKYLIKNFKG